MGLHTSIIIPIAGTADDDKKNKNPTKQKV